MAHKPKPDSRRWVVLATIFVNLAMAYGIWYSYSVFLVALLDEFGWSRAMVAGGFSVFLLVHGSLSPFIGSVGGRVGPRRIVIAGACTLGVGMFLTAQTTEWWHLYLAFGVITAAGIGMAGWLPSVLLVRGWFPAHVGTAVGIVSAGIGVGILGIVPLTQYLIELFGWRWTFRLLAVLTTGWILPATLWLVRDPASLEAVDPGPADADASRTYRGRAHWTLSTAVRDRRYWALAGVFFTGNVATQMIMVHQVAYLVDHGVTPLAAASVGGLVGLASILGKLGWGSLSDRSGREVAYTFAFTCTATSLGILVLAGRQPASLLPYVYAVLMGLGYAGTAPVTPAAASDLFAGAGFSTIFGSLHAMQCLGGATGAWAAGKIFDWTASYAIAIWLAVACALVAPTLLWIAAPRRPHPPPGQETKA